MAGYREDEILLQLDRGAAPYGDYGFPALDHGYNYPVDCRLHALRDDARWALVIETLGYNPRAANLIDVIQSFGNCLDGPPGYTNGDFLWRVENWEDVEDINSPEVVRDGLAAIVVRGHRIPVAVASASTILGLLRSLVPDHRDELLAIEDEWRRRIPKDLPQILQLEEWNHPDVAGGVMPSSTSTFQMLAAVLASGDVSLYAPTAQPNTHWSHWPEGGSL
jgi:hypothetical protein